MPPTVQACLDEPLAGALHLRQRVPVRGWLHLGARQSELVRIVARLDDEPAGNTTTPHVRPDVAAALHLEPQAATGFHFLALAPTTAQGRTAVLTVEAELRDGARLLLATRAIRIAASDYTAGDYGDLCNPTHTWPMPRRFIYSSGYPSPVADGHCVREIAARVQPGERVLDVGCGIGAYAAPVRAMGCDWTGCETSGAHLARLEQAALPARRIRRWPWYRLPARDGEFDVSLAIEVLEHIPKPERFVREMARITRRRAIFSVPDCSIIPLLHARRCVPWHLLEKDHHLFFSRFRLHGLLAPHFRRVEVIDYGEFPVKGAEDLTLPFHLLAIADH